MTPKLILSVFPGIGLLDRAFEEEGFVVVRGPDLIFGGDVRTFCPPAGVFDGVIGGPPCQDFSSARRSPVILNGDGVAMLAQFARVVECASPRWWLCENVPSVPDVAVPGYRSLWKASQPTRPPRPAPDWLTWPTSGEPEPVSEGHGPSD